MPDCGAISNGKDLEYQTILVGASVHHVDMGQTSVTDPGTLIGLERLDGKRVGSNHFSVLPVSARSRADCHSPSSDWIIVPELVIEPLDVPTKIQQESNPMKKPSDFKVLYRDIAR